MKTREYLTSKCTVKNHSNQKTHAPENTATRNSSSSDIIELHDTKTADNITNDDSTDPNTTGSNWSATCSRRSSETKITSNITNNSSHSPHNHLVSANKLTKRDLSISTRADNQTQHPDSQANKLKVDDPDTINLKKLVQSINETIQNQSKPVPSAFSSTQII